jgi:hypothetical protein
VRGIVPAGPEAKFAPVMLPGSRIVLVLLIGCHSTPPCLPTRADHPHPVEETYHFAKRTKHDTTNNQEKKRKKKPIKKTRSVPLLSPIK